MVSDFLQLLLDRLDQGRGYQLALHCDICKDLCVAAVLELPTPDINNEVDRVLVVCDFGEHIDSVDRLLSQDFFVWLVIERFDVVENVFRVDRDEGFEPLEP